MGKPIQLVTRPSAVAKDAVRVLEDALEKVRKGELSSVAIAGVRSDGSAWGACSESDNQVARLGAVTILYDLLLRIAEESRG